MADAATLSVLLKTRGFDTARREMRQYRQDVGDTGASARKTGLDFKAMALQITAIAAAGSAIAFVGLKMINAAADAEEMRNKFDATFGAAGPLAKAELDLFSERVGRSSLALQGMAADTGAVLKSAGLMETQAADLSVNIAKLATDVASFTNASDAAVLQAFTRALTGEREALKTYGISILDAEVKTKALALGFELVDGNLSSSAKALTTYQLLLDKTGDSQGDAEKTALSYTNQMKDLQGAMADFSAELGSVLIPAATESVGILRDLATVAREVNDRTVEATGSNVGFVESLEMVAPQVKVWHELADALGVAADDINAAKTAALEAQIEYDKWLESARLLITTNRAMPPTLAEINNELAIFGSTSDDLIAINKVHIGVQEHLTRVFEDQADQLAELTSMTQRQEDALADYRFATNETAQTIQEAGISQVQVIQGLAELMDTTTESIVADLAAQGLSWQSLQDVTSLFGDEIRGLLTLYDDLVNKGTSSLQQLKEAHGGFPSGGGDTDPGSLGRAGAIREEIARLRAANSHDQNRLDRLERRGDQAGIDAILAMIAHRNEQILKLEQELNSLPRAAAGANVMRAGRVMVGERGREILDLPAGARVTPLSGGGGGGGHHFHWHQNAPMYGFMDTEREIGNIVEKVLHTRRVS